MYILARPRIEKCNARPKHYLDKRTGHYYFFSGTHGRIHGLTHGHKGNIHRRIHGQKP